MNGATTFVVLAHAGRYVVCRALPGTGGVLDVIADCPTYQAALRERDWQQAEHQREREADLRDAFLRGARRAPGVHA